MALGIPGDVVTVVLLGALIIHDVAPSPTFVSDRPDIAYTILLAYFFAHFVMVCLQAFGLRVFTIIGRAPNYFVGTIIIFCAAIGVFVWDNAVFDIWTVFLFGMLGYTMRCLDFPAAPFILGSVSRQRRRAEPEPRPGHQRQPDAVPDAAVGRCCFSFSPSSRPPIPCTRNTRASACGRTGTFPACAWERARRSSSWADGFRPSVGIVLACFAAYSLWCKAKAGIRLWPGRSPRRGMKDPTAMTFPGQLSS